MEPLKVTEIPSPDKEQINSLYEASHIFDGFAQFGEKKYVLLKSTYINLQKSLRSFKIRPDDVFIGGFQRSGTHWLAELTWLLCNNLDFAKAEEIKHVERILFFDFNPKVLQNYVPNEVGKVHVPVDGVELFFGSLPSPRFFKTHFPLSLLPTYLLDTTKMVYIARDPRDAAVSGYYYHKSHKAAKYVGDLKTYWSMIVKDIGIYGPYFESVKEYWNARHHPNLLFLFYEELLEDLPRTVRRVAEFFGHKYSDDDFERLCEYLTFNRMKKNKAVNLDPNLGQNSTQVVRKGVIGGWKEEFDEEMTKWGEKWIAENLKDTDLRFPSMK